jgi:hypothetical protein
MRTIFALFESYPEAKRAVDELLEREFEEHEMNVIVQELAAKGAMDVNMRTADVDKSAKLGNERIKGLNRLIAGRQAVTVPDVGRVYAAGEMATIVTKTAATQESQPTRFKDTLVDFDVPEEIAEFYTEGVMDGGVLFWLRTEDTRAAEAANVLSKTRGEKIGSYTQ